MLSQPAAVIIVVIPYHQIAVVGFAALSGQDHLTVPLFHRYQREVSAEAVIPARNSIELHIAAEIAVQEVLHHVRAARFPDQRTRAPYRTGRCVRTNIDIQAVIETEILLFFRLIECFPLGQRGRLQRHGQPAYNAAVIIVEGNTVVVLPRCAQIEILVIAVHGAHLRSGKARIAQPGIQIVRRAEHSGSILLRLRLRQHQLRQLLLLFLRNLLLNRFLRLEYLLLNRLGRFSRHGRGGQQAQRHQQGHQ